MDRKKIDVKYIESDISKEETFSSRDDGLARLSNREVGVFINSTAEPYGSLCFNSEVKRFKKSSARRVTSLRRQTRILMYKAKLDRLMEELKQNEAYEKDLHKMREHNIKNYNRKEISVLKLEELLVLKKKLENLRDDLEEKRVEMESSFSLLMLSKNEDNKKKEADVPFRQKNI